MTHTPGPWEYVPAEYLSHDAPGWTQMLSPGGIMAMPSEDEASWVIEGDIEHKDDALLIAAAPELLSALYKLRGLAMNVESDLLFNGHVTELTRNTIDAAIKTASAAIEKADPLTSPSETGAS